MRHTRALEAVSGILVVAGLGAQAGAMLHPTVGRWIQRDPAGYVDGMSLYAYVGNRPVTHSDPTGLTDLGTVALAEPPQPMSGGSRNDVVHWDLVPAPESLTRTPFSDVFGCAMDNADRWEDWLMNTQKGHDYVNNSEMLTFVEDQGELLGHLRLERFDDYRKDEANLRAMLGPETLTYKGVWIEGGFVAHCDPKARPHCCRELRWSQVLLRAKAGRALPYRAGGFDGLDNEGKQVNPFYWRDNKPVRTPLDIVDRSSEWHGAHANIKGYTTHFVDKPKSPESHWPVSFRFKLCLVCVTHRGPLAGHLRTGFKGYGRVLKCITYGYSVNEVGRVTLERPNVTLDHLLPGDTVGWSLR